MNRVHWGIMGTGGMADAFVANLRLVPHAEVVAVGSARREMADAFASRHDIAAAYSPHEGVAHDPDVDVVYVTTTNERHHADTLACLAGGKPVLCEKPFALDHADAAEMVAAARSSGLFLMEAMWMLFQPFFGRVERLLRDGAIGEVQLLQADFGFPISHPRDRRWWNPALGGGSLLDIGIYPLTLARALLGHPLETNAVGVLDGGVDSQVAIVSGHPGGTLSLVGSTFSADTPLEAVISGTEGRLRLHAPFHHATRITRYRRGDLIEEIDLGDDAWGHRHEIEEVHRCLALGRLESERVPLSDTLAMMGLLDDIRGQIGLSYPGE